MTTQEIKDLAQNKIRTISVKVGNFGSSMQFKVMKEKGEIIVVTRKGLLKYLGNAEYAYYSGKKNVDYKTFKTAESASKFINQIAE